MVLRGNGIVWNIPTANEEEEEADTVSSWTQNTNTQNHTQTPDDVVFNPSTTFKSVLETDWYLPTPQQHQNQIHDNNIIHNSLINTNHQEMRDFTSFVDSSSSCSPSQPCFTSLLNLTTPTSTPFDNGFDLGCELPSFLGHSQVGTSFMGFNGVHDFHASQLLTLDDNNGENSGFGGVGFEGFDGNGLFPNRVSKVLRPLEEQQLQQPTLFQKRAMSRQSSEKLGNLDVPGVRYGGEVGGSWLGELERNKRKRYDLEGEVDEAGGSFDVSGFNYDSDDRNVESKFEDESVRNNGGSNSNANSTVTAAGGDQKGKKKGMPAKNLMAERRRRKKLNDRLYMLRSVVPKISKMDRASILGDAIDYLKELFQRINDLHNELESNAPGSLVPPSSMSFHPLTPTLPTLPCRVKEELCPGSLPSPKGQPARVEVKLREGRAVNIHMFCARRPGLLLSTMRALDNLGLDIQQAVISCFNGFALDIFRAEQCSEGQEILPEQIKAVLLDSTGFHGVM